MAASSTGVSRKLQPLFFPEIKKDLCSFYDQDKDVPIFCLVCEEAFTGTDGQIVRSECLQHLFRSHNIVIHNASEIASFKFYSQYWRKRIASESNNLSSLFPVIETKPETKTDKSELYYLISNDQQEDKDLRLFMQKTRLEALLEIQQTERNDTQFNRKCLFCHEVFTGNRKVLFDHMLHSHHFNIGLPDNIVFVGQFLDLLQSKLDNLQCLYCERTFRDYVTLRDHMRKKQHKKINAKNQIYDKFYMINYLEFGKSWEMILKEDDDGVIDSADQNNWSDWTEINHSFINCLFCICTFTNLADITGHMKEEHHFDLDEVFKELDYYCKVKLINYIRKQVYNHSCIYCLIDFNNHCELVDHLKTKRHFLLPKERYIWDQPQYLFPTYENDNLLYVIEDKD